MREKSFYVYKIICIKDEWNGKFYIGSHYGYVNDRYTGSGRKIKEYFNLYGKDKTYKKEILEISDNEIYIKDKEREIIRENIENDLCLNMIINAVLPNHKKLSQINKGKIRNEICRKNISNALKDVYKNEDMKKMRSKISSGNTNTKGRIWINNMSISKMIYPKDLDTYIQKGWQRGRKLSI